MLIYIDFIYTVLYIYIYIKTLNHDYKIHNTKWIIECVWDCDFVEKKCDFKQNRRK
jgi:hypothetical protein